MSSSLRILLIGVPETVLEQVRGAGYLPDGRQAHSRDEVVAALGEGPWDLVLSAYALSNLDAATALALVRSKDIDVPFILVTEPIGDDLAAELTRAGVNDIIVTTRLNRIGPAVHRELREARRRRMAREASFVRRPRTAETAGIAFRALVENSPDLIARFDADLRRVYVNPAIERLTGMNAQELIGTTLRELNFDERFAEPIEQAMRRAFATGADEALDVLLPGPGGEHVYHARVVAECTPGGGIESVLVISRDITSLHRSEKRMRDFIDSADDAIFTLDINGRILDVNPALERMLGLEKRAVVGRPLPDLVHPASVAAVDESVRNVASGSERAHFFASLLATDGSIVEVDASASRQSGRETQSIFVIARDVTESKRLQRELEDARHMASLGRIVTLVSHEFNNVLMGIQPFADRLVRVSGEPHVVDTARSITHAVQRGRRITEDLRTFTQPAPPVAAPVDTGIFLTEAVRDLQPLLRPKVSVTIKAHRPVMMNVDRTQIMRVLTNVILNARDALGDGGGSITIAVEATAPAMVRFSVIDDGPGIAAEDQQRIFDPFFTTRNGAGLGLTTARQIVAAHRGEITVDSAPGRGTVVHFSLPLFEGEALQCEPAEVEWPTDILLIEDDELVAAGIVALLEDEKKNVVLAMDGSAALDALRTFTPQALVIDVNLPDCNGFDLYERIAASVGVMPVVFSSGHADASRLKSLYAPAGAQLLTKPFVIETLLHALAALSRPPLPGVR